MAAGAPLAAARAVADVEAARTALEAKGVSFHSEIRRAFQSAPGPIRTADLSLRRNEKEEAKEAQKWLRQARVTPVGQGLNTRGYGPIWVGLGH